MESTAPTVKLTHHFKVWYGTQLKENVVNLLEIQRKKNPTNDMVLFVNKEILENKENEALLNRLKENNIQVVDVFSVINSKDLTESRLKYPIEYILNKGLDYLKKAELAKGEEANRLKIYAYRCFAGASDVTRCVRSVMEYKCSEGNYRAYSDTDYYLFKIPDHVSGTCLLGTSEEKEEVEFNRTIRFSNRGMDFNFMAIPPNHPLINEVRDNWINTFGLNDYVPTDLLSDTDKGISSLDVIFDETKQAIDSYANFPQPAVAALSDLMNKIILPPYSAEKILIDQRLNEIIFINMKQGSWHGKKETDFSNDITINELKDQIELTISKDAFKLPDKEKPSALMGKELLKFLILGNVIPNMNLKDLDDIPSDFKIIIPPEKKAYFLEMITAFVDAYKISSFLKGNLRDMILKSITDLKTISTPRSPSSSSPSSSRSESTSSFGLFPPSSPTSPSSASPDSPSTKRK